MAVAVFVLVAAFALAGCTGQPLSTREEGTLGGGVLGAGTGAIIGAAVGHPRAGAAIGGALGAGTGFVVGNSMQNQEASPPAAARSDSDTSSARSRASAARFNSFRATRAPNDG